MKAIKVSGYFCDDCGYLHEDEWEAVRCCSNTSEFDGFQCMCCFELFDNKKKADNCCNPETTVKGYMYVYKAREAQGQLRLL